LGYGTRQCWWSGSGGVSIDGVVLVTAFFGVILGISVITVIVVAIVVSVVVVVVEDARNSVCVVGVVETARNAIAAVFVVVIVIVVAEIVVEIVIEIVTVFATDAAITVVGVVGYASAAVVSSNGTITANMAILGIREILRRVEGGGRGKGRVGGEPKGEFLFEALEDDRHCAHRLLL